MIGKLINTAALVSLATLLAGGGFVGYLCGTGRMNASRLEKMAAVLRGELDDPTDQTSTGAELEPATPEPPPEPTGHSAAEAQARRQREHLEGLSIERAQADLAAQRTMLSQVLQHVVQEQEQLATNRAAFSEQQDRRANALRDEGFQKELALVSGLKPDQAKEHIIRCWQTQRADAVRLITALEERQAKRILDLLKTPEEQQIMSELLEQIRLQGTEGYARTSRMTAGDTAP